MKRSEFESELILRLKYTNSNWHYMMQISHFRWKELAHEIMNFFTETEAWTPEWDPEDPTDKADDNS